MRGGGNLTKAPFNVAGGLPSFVTTSLTFTDPVNSFLSQGRNTDTYNIQDNANWVKGKHSLSFGVPDPEGSRVQLRLRRNGPELHRQRVRRSDPVRL